jgi:HSP20 family molecular chaperone IbpA
MKRNSLLFVAVLALASWAFAQQPSSPAPPPAGSPPPPAGTTAAPSSAPASQPPDSPAPPASPDAGQTPSSGQSGGTSGQSQDSSTSSQSGSTATQDQNASASDNNSGRPLTSDEARKQIEHKLQSEPGLSSRDIHVDVTDHTLVLNGSVPTTNQSLLAQRIAQSYAGSRRVSNKLNIQTSSPANGSPSSGQPQQATPPQGE